MRACEHACAAVRLVGTSPRRCENLVRPLNAAPRAPRDTIHVRRQCVRTRCSATRSSTPAAWRCRLDCTPFHLHHPSSSAAPCCPATRALQRGWRPRVSRRAFPVAKRRRALAGLLCAPAPPAAAADAPSCPYRLRATHAYPRIERAAAGARGESSGAVFVDTRVHTFTLCSSSRRAQIGCPASAEHQRAAVVAGARKDGGKRGGMPLTGLPAYSGRAQPLRSSASRLLWRRQLRRLYTLDHPEPSSGCRASARCCMKTTSPGIG
jgi:hypothetical protein